MEDDCLGEFRVEFSALFLLILSLSHRPTKILCNSMYWVRLKILSLMHLFCILLIMSTLVSGLFRPRVLLGSNVIAHSSFSSSSRRRATPDLHTDATSSSFGGTIITSLNNEHVKLMRSLQMKKKREAHQLVLLEGFRQITDALSNGLVANTIAFTEASISSPMFSRFEAALAQSSSSSDQHTRKPLQFMVSDEVYHSMSDTVSGQGIIASFTKPVFTDLLRDDNSTSHLSPLVLLLDRLADPGNVGTLIRSAYGLGASAVVAVESCDLWAPKVLRASMGSALCMPIFETSWNEAPALLQHLLASRTAPPTVASPNNQPVIQVIVADGNEQSHKYFDADFVKQPTVLVVGSEATGVSSQVYALSDYRLKHDDSRIKTENNQLSDQNFGKSYSDSGYDNDGGSPSRVESAQDIDNYFGASDPSSLVGRSNRERRRMKVTNATAPMNFMISNVECRFSVKAVQIPMVRSLESFNAGVAGSILLAEAAQQRSRR